MTLAQLANRNRDDWSPASRIVSVREAAVNSVIRMRSKLQWLDTALGGGFVRSSVVLLHGEPGAGKSTLLAQAANGIAGALYASGEEPLNAVAARAMRLGADFNLIAESDMATVLSAAGRAPLLIIDSLQRMRPSGAEGTCMAVDHARAHNVCVVLVCHETKGGVHAGVRTIEHDVDCTIRLSRDPRAIVVEKNRYGPTGAVTPLRMTERGLIG